MAVYQRPDIPGITWRRENVDYHGPGREYVFPGRRAVVGKWPAKRPEECRDADGKGEWLAGGRVMVCPGCGLDCT